METPDSPDVVIAKRLLDHATLGGFTFQRAAPGVDDPLVGHRVSDDWVDLIHIEGSSRDVEATGLDNDLPGNLDEATALR